MDAVKSAYGKYATFSGRAMRSEFWWFVLFFVIVEFILVFVATAAPSIGFLILAVFALGSLIPYFALGVRRLHDTGHSGWWWLITVIPFGQLVLLYFWAKSGTDGDNKFGPDPRGAGAAG